MRRSSFAPLRALGLVGVLAFTTTANAQARPPLPQGSRELPPGQVPAVCPSGETFDVNAPTYRHYFSEAAKQWVSAPWCYPRWGYLEASASQVVAPGAKVTFRAIPTDGSNSAIYAPETRSIVWKISGKVVSGCGEADLECTIVPTEKATSEWQWFEVEVSMPRTFFIDSPGSNCAGQHLCAGVQTHAWAFAGVAPAGDAASPASPGDGGGCGVARTTRADSAIGLLGLALALVVRRGARNRRRPRFLHGKHSLPRLVRAGFQKAAFLPTPRKR